MRRAKKTPQNRLRKVILVLFPHLKGEPALAYESAMTANNQVQKSMNVILVLSYCK